MGFPLSMTMHIFQLKWNLHWRLRKRVKWNRIVAVFQPHRFTRTNDLAAAFSDCFQDADEIVITGIYSAGEKPIPGVTGKLVADAVTSKAIGKNVRYCEHREDLVVFLRELLVEGDLCLTLGAGDLTYHRPANGSIRSDR